MDDKSSVLGETINCIKQLQERVKTLEEEQATKQELESVKKSEPLIEDEEGSSGENSGQPLPDIEARVCDKSTVLVKIHCEKQKGVLVKIISEIENMNLVVANTSVSPFGTLAHDITIIAEMEKEFNMTEEDIVKALRLAW